MRYVYVYALRYVYALKFTYKHL